MYGNHVPVVPLHLLEVPCPTFSAFALPPLPGRHLFFFAPRCPHPPTLAMQRSLTQLLRDLHAGLVAFSGAAAELAAAMAPPAASDADDWQPAAKRRAVSGESWWQFRADASCDLAQVLRAASAQWSRDGAGETFSETLAWDEGPRNRSFYQSHTYFAKVHEFDVHAERKRDNWRAAGTAFLEASATSYVCGKEGWWSRTFGVLCGSGRSERAYVFIVRHKLTPAAADAPICDLFFRLCKDLFVLHNDAHRSNAMTWHLDGRLQAVDLERASQLARPRTDEEWAVIKLFHKVYYTHVCNPDQRDDACLPRMLMQTLRSCGLDATHRHFSQIFEDDSFRQTAFNHTAFLNSPVTRWNHCAWLHVLHQFHIRDCGPFLEHSSAGYCIKLDRAAPSVICRVWFSLPGGDTDMMKEARITKCTTEPALAGHGTISYLDKDRFEAFPRTADPWHLTDHDTTMRFVKTALDYFQNGGGRMDDAGECSCSDEEDEQLRAAPRVDEPLRAAPRVQNWQLAKMYGNVHVYNSVLRSMRRRYHPDSPAIRELEGVRDTLRQPAAHPRPNALKLSHFRCRAVVVNSDVTREECLQYMKDNATLSLDVEDINPKFQNEEGCALIQLGTTERVFLIQVRAQLREPFRTQLADVLRGKTLVHWGGNDAAALRRVLLPARGSQVTFTLKNVQQQWYSGRGNNLADVISSRTQHLLDKTWQLSGWDVAPLHAAQIEYAALDVVCCHALYVMAKDNFQLVFENGVYHLRRPP
jgi:hypothetical protein